MKFLRNLGCGGFSVYMMVARMIFFGRLSAIQYNNAEINAIMSVEWGDLALWHNVCKRCG